MPGVLCTADIFQNFNLQFGFRRIILKKDNSAHINLQGAEIKLLDHPPIIKPHGYLT